MNKDERIHELEKQVAILEDQLSEPELIVEGENDPEWIKVCDSTVSLKLKTD